MREPEKQSMKTLALHVVVTSDSALNFHHHIQFPEHRQVGSRSKKEILLNECLESTSVGREVSRIGQGRNWVARQTKQCPVNPTGMRGVSRALQVCPEL